MKLGIDFGTCYSSAALLINETPRPLKEPISHGYSFPSSVFVTEEGKLLVGQAAENARQKNPQRYRAEFKRDLGTPNPYAFVDSYFLPEELIAEVLKKLKQEAEKVAQERGASPLNQVQLTIPATYQSYKRKLMEDAAHQAGFSEIELVEEPVAAAYYYSAHATVKSGEIILVYDLGGGTFDATLIQKQDSGYQLLGMPKGLSNCGGIEFDRQIFQKLKSNCSEELRQQLSAKNGWLARAIVSNLCRDLKHQLSEEEEASIYVPISLGKVEPFSLARTTFNQLIAPLIEETLDCCDQLLRNTGQEWSQINQVLLVGGSCRIPYVQEAVGKKLGQSPLLVDDPELAVCFGATLNANQNAYLPLHDKVRAMVDQAFKKQFRSNMRVAVERCIAISNGEVDLFEDEGGFDLDALLAEYDTPALEAGRANSSSQLQTFSFEIITVDDRGEINHRRDGKAQQIVEDLGNGVLLQMVEIPGGSFLMGAPETEKGSDDEERPQHRVEVAPFLMGKYPVTQAQYQAIMGENPSGFSGANNPVERVNWYKAKKFYERLSEKTGREYRLPSEAEWEYACRAGTTTPFYFGETITTDLANYNSHLTYGKEPKGEFREKTTPVGSFPPNAFGLYDMHGNVWEWCEDVWHENYEGALNDGSPWLTGRDHGYRVLRGGSWDLSPRDCRCAVRYWLYPEVDDNDIGFRVVSSSVRTL